MGVTTAWLVLLSFQAWQHGKKQNKMPEPFYFLGASAVMGVAGIIGMANPRLGTLFAWALVLGAFVSGTLRVVPANSESIPFEGRAPGSNIGTPLGYTRDANGPAQSGG